MTGTLLSPLLYIISLLVNFRNCNISVKTKLLSVRLCLSISQRIYITKDINLINLGFISTLLMNLLIYIIVECSKAFFIQINITIATNYCSFIYILRFSNNLCGSLFFSYTTSLTEHTRCLFLKNLLVDFYWSSKLYFG
jgi:hypothetical protein